MKKKENIIKLLTIIIIISSIFLLSELYMNDINNQEINKKNLIDFQNIKLNSLFFEINNIPGGISKDILFLNKIISINDFNQGSINNINFFIEENSIYNEICLIDENKKNIFSNKKNNECLALKNLKENFEQLKKDEIYMSKMFKNNENDSVIIYISPIFENNKKTGYMIFEINNKYFLEDIRNINRNFDEIYLIDNEGNYLSHLDKKIEFSQKNFCKENDICNEIKSSSGNKIENGKYIYFFKKIYPTASSFEIYKGCGESLEDYYWILITKSQTKNILNKEINPKNILLILPIMIIILSLLIIQFFTIKKDKKNLWIFFITFFIFTILFSFLITSTINNKLSFTSKNSILDILVILIVFGIFLKSTKIKANKNKKQKKYLMIGSFFIIIERFLQVFLQEFYAMHTKEPFVGAWGISIIFALIGYLSLIVGFGGMKK